MTADLTWLLLAPNRSIRQTGTTRTCRPSGSTCRRNCVLVDTPDGRLLWGYQLPAGLGAALGPDRPAMTSSPTTGLEEEYLGLPLKQLGVPPVTSNYVVLSHLHFDHAGNVNLFQETNAPPGLQRQGEGVGLRLRRPFNGAHLKRLRRPELRDRRRRR